MKKFTILALAGVCLLVSPLAAQNRGAPAGHGSQHGGISGDVRSAPGGIAGRRGPVTWGDFHHDTSPARISPHRFGGTNLPVPNAWHGNIGGFAAGRWQAGSWHHVLHNGRLGWWWTVGPDWYFYDAPVYPYPDLYTPPGVPFGWWYWCDASQEYYPYVTTCAVPWESVMPRS